MLAVGLFTRIVAAAIAIETAVISFGVLWPVWGWAKHGMEYALLMGILALAILFRGAAGIRSTITSAASSSRS